MPQQTFGAAQSPQDAVRLFQEAMSSGFNPSTLRTLRDKRLREMERNRDFQDDSRAEQQIGRQGPVSAADAQRDRMMGWDRGTPTFTTGATKSDVRNLAADLDDDPDTGLEAQDRTRRISHALDAAATTQRQEVGDAVDVTSRRNAFADFLKAKGIRGGQYAADVSPEGEQALDAASGRKQDELGITAAARLAASGRGPLAALQPGQDPLEGLSPQEQGIIKGLAEYRVQLPGGMALRTPEWQDRLGRALALDPSFDQTQYASRQKLRSDFTSGKSGQNVQALATVQDHLDALKKKADALGNYGLQPVNQFKNWMSKMTGGKAIQGYEFERNAVADELSAALKSSGATNEEIRGWKERLDSSQSPDQFTETFHSAADLVEKRLNESRNRYESGMGKPGAFGEFMKGTQERAARTAGSPQIGERKTFPNGRTAVWDGAGWDPE